jgi:hypothetical protein
LGSAAIAEIPQLLATVTNAARAALEMALQHPQPHARQKAVARATVDRRERLGIAACARLPSLTLAATRFCRSGVALADGSGGRHRELALVDQLDDFGGDCRGRRGRA